MHRHKTVLADLCILYFPVSRYIQPRSYNHVEQLLTDKVTGSSVQNKIQSWLRSVEDLHELEPLSANYTRL